jgi:hypothetical protein
VAAPRKMEGIGVAMAKDYYEYVVYGQKDPKKETGRPIASFSRKLPSLLGRPHDLDVPVS